MNYKKRITELERLRRAGISSVFDRTVHLKALMFDQDYRTSVGDLDDFQMSEHLDAYVSDSALSVLELLAVLEKFPKDLQWQEMSLRELYRKSVEKSDAETDKPQRSRRGVTVKEHERALDNIRELEYSVKAANERADEKDKMINELRDEVKTLVAQLARSEGRIIELERQLKLQHV
jgi:hypothetical protein